MKKFISALLVTMWLLLQYGCGGNSNMDMFSSSGSGYRHNYYKSKRSSNMAVSGGSGTATVAQVVSPPP